MSNSASASFHAVVRGRVQGVFFRAFVKSHANALGLTGYVRNLRSGEVEVQAEGERGKLEELLQILHQGPRAARVDKVEVSWRDYSGDFSSFSIRS
jgi:acylphosphatase